MSGTFEDVQESLIANFLFDGDGSDELISASPRVSGQQGTNQLLPVGTVLPISRRALVVTGACVFQPWPRRPWVQTSLGTRTRLMKYLPTTWHCLRGFIANVGLRLFPTCVKIDRVLHRKTVECRTSFVSTESSTTLKLEYARDGSVSSSDSLSLSGLACSTWHYVGFLFE